MIVFRDVQYCGLKSACDSSKMRIERKKEDYFKWTIL